MDQELRDAGLRQFEGKQILGNFDTSTSGRCGAAEEQMLPMFDIFLPLCIINKQISLTHFRYIDVAHNRQCCDP